MVTLTHEPGRLFDDMGAVPNATDTRRQPHRSVMKAAVLAYIVSRLDPETGRVALPAREIAEALLQSGSFVNALIGELCDEMALVCVEAGRGKWPAVYALPDPVPEPDAVPAEDALTEAATLLDWFAEGSLVVLEKRDGRLVIVGTARGYDNLAHWARTMVKAGL